MLGNDALEPHRAGVLQKFCAVALDFLRQLYGTGGAVEEVFQQVPAHREFGPREVVAVGIKKIEREKHSFRR